jgi:hypothetical protein
VSLRDSREQKKGRNLLGRIVGLCFEEREARVRRDTTILLLDGLIDRYTLVEASLVSAPPQTFVNEHLKHLGFQEQSEKVAQLFRSTGDEFLFRKPFL